MAGLHALHKILAAHAQPARTTVTPGEYLQLVPDVFAFGISYNAEEANKFEATMQDLGVKEFPLRERIFAFQDHGAPAPSPALRTQRPARSHGGARRPLQAPDRLPAGRRRRGLTRPSAAG